ncbi:alpha-L-fucosidase [Haloferula sp. A504]|uniref:alpha-L-fucosidase n=1 Tax=Haloferula sp. A504 TaxID=3373601 RepID=UPI0031C05ADB|nr:alpha-L-fucosidase [Verrucomicrobiaceae bacterium E54]
MNASRVEPATASAQPNHPVGFIVSRTRSFTTRLVALVLCAAGFASSLDGSDKPHLRTDYEAPAYTEASADKMRWFRDAKFGLFIHWGVYAVPAGFWSKDNTFEGWKSGKDLHSPHAYSERLLHATDMPLGEYEKIAQLFDWSGFDAQKIVDLCHASGQRYIVITTKHHDGFAIWPSQASAWNIRDATPYGRSSGRDPLKELADACARTKTDGPFEVRLCFYYSHCADWWERDAASFGYEPHPDPTPEVFQSYLDRKVKPQLTELLTGYGDIGMIWFDVPRIITPTQARELAEHVNRLSPNTIINGRLGRGLGNYLNCGDNGDIGIPVEYPWETGSSINHSFGYHSGDHEHKEPAWIIRKLIRTAAHGGNYLLNIGPKADGTIAREDMETLTEVGKWTSANREAVFGTRQTPYTGESSVQHPWGTCTRKGGDLFLIVTNWPSSGEVSLPLLRNEIEAVTVLEGEVRKQLPHRRNRDASGNATIIIDVSGVTAHPVATVIRLETDGDEIRLDPFRHAYDPESKRISLAPANFQAFASNIKSLNLSYDPEADAIVNWRYNKGSGATVAWTFEVPESGEYRVQIEYGSIKRASGIPIDLLVDGERSLSFDVTHQKGWDKYEKAAVGTVRFEKGRHDLALDPQRSDVDSVWIMQLKGLTLTKQEKEG